MSLLIASCAKVSLVIYACKQVKFLKFKLTCMRKIASNTNSEQKTFKVQKNIKETL